MVRRLRFQTRRRETDDRTIAIVFQDINGRKRAEESLRFQAKLLDTVEQSAIATNLDGRIIYWNKFAERLYGWTAEETVNQNILEITTADTSAEQAGEIMSQLRAGKSRTGEFTVKRRDGTTFPAQIIDSPVTDAEGNLIGMQERAALVGGTLEIESSSRQGTTIFARVPAAFVKKKKEK